MSLMSDDDLTIEAQDALAIAKLAEAGADLDAPRTIWHFVYMAQGESAAAIADELRRRGFHIEQRHDTDAKWLVLASHEAILSSATLASTRHSMEALIAELGAGEYDGWEAEARPQKGHAKPN